MTKYVSMAFSLNMVEPPFTMVCKEMPPEVFVERYKEGDFISALNPSHAGSIDAFERKYGVSLDIPEKAPMITLKSRDSIYVLQFNFGRRLKEGERYTNEEVQNASIRVLHCIIL